MTTRIKDVVPGPEIQLLAPPKFATYTKEKARELSAEIVAGIVAALDRHRIPGSVLGRYDLYTAIEQAVESEHRKAASGHNNVLVVLGDVLRRAEQWGTTNHEPAYQLIEDLRETLSIVLDEWARSTR